MKSRYKSSLVKSTLGKMIAAVSLVIIASTVLSYWQVFKGLESQTLTQIKLYIMERGLKESMLFKLAQARISYRICHWIATMKSVCYPILLWRCQ